MSRIEIGKTGYTLGVVLFLLMGAAAFAIAPGSPLAATSGICFPGAAEWSIAPWLSSLINMLLLLVCALGMGALNREYHFVQTDEALLTVMTLVIAASCPWDVQRLCGGTLLLAANAFAFALLFGGSEHKDNTQRIFAASSTLALGSTFDTAFVPFIVALIASTLVLKILRLRELAALILGLAAPYWAIIGLGIRMPASFSFPMELGFMPLNEMPSDLFVIAIATLSTIAWSLPAGIANALKLLRTNARTRRFNTTIAIFGIVAIAGCIFNFANLTAYLPTLALIASVQFCNALALYPGRTSVAVPTATIFLYTAVFILASSIF